MPLGSHGTRFQERFAIGNASTIYIKSGLQTVGIEGIGIRHTGRLSKAFTTTSQDEKNASEYLFSVSGPTLSKFASMLISGFIAFTARAAMADFGDRISSSRNKNLIFK